MQKLFRYHISESAEEYIKSFFIDANSRGLLQEQQLLLMRHLSIKRLKSNTEKECYEGPGVGVAIGEPEAWDDIVQFEAPRFSLYLCGFSAVIGDHVIFYRGKLVMERIIISGSINRV